MPFQMSQGLNQACRDHVDDIGRHGLASHEGSDKSKMIDRIQRYGKWKTSLAENICFDDVDPKEILFNMIVGNEHIFEFEIGNLKSR